MDLIASIGHKIKGMRTSLGLTLQQVADSAGCSAAYISQIENDKASPSIATLKRIAKVLNARIVDFFVDEVREEKVVSEPHEWSRVSLKGWRAEIKQMVPSVSQKHMQPFYTVIQPGGGSRESYSHVGEEFGLVLEGEMTLKVGSDTFLVKAPSSFYYSSLLPHSWINEGDQPCRVVWVVSPPSW